MKLKKEMKLVYMKLYMLSTSTNLCNFSSESDIRTVSSAYLILFIFLPHIFIPFTSSSLSMTTCEHKEKRLGDSTQSCLTPLWISIQPLLSSSILITAFCSQYKAVSTLKSARSTPNSLSLSANSPCYTLSNAFSKSTTHIKRSFCFSTDFSITVLSIKVAFLVPTPFLKPNCTLSIVSLTFLSNLSFNTFRTIFPI